ncbi:Nitroreductase domain-containing protein [Durusdinium trenchii]
MTRVEELQEMDMDIKEVPGNCSTATSRKSPTTQACCKEAVERLSVTGQMRQEYLRHQRLTSHLEQWWRHLSPTIRRSFEARQADWAAGRQWSGVAVLLTGQVRDGTKQYVAQNIRRNVFKELAGASTMYHIFAVLEYTRFGFSWRGSKNETRDFEDKDVRQMLEVYGGNYTLVEWGAAEKAAAYRDLRAKCLVNHKLRRVYALPLQYMKIKAALQLMRAYEDEFDMHFALVVRIRPDVTYASSLGRLLKSRLDAARAPVNASVPNICGSIGGGLGDAFLLADRASADALGQVAAFVQSCPVDDHCQSWAVTKEACLKVPNLASGSAGMQDEVCTHAWVPSLLRQGVPTTNCGISGMLGSGKP